MKLLLASLEDFIEELKDNNETEVRLLSNMRELPGEPLRRYSCRVLVTAEIFAGMVMCSFYVGCEPEDAVGRPPEKLFQRQNKQHDAIKQQLEEAGLTVKPGVWVDDGEVIDTVYHPNGKTESQTEPKQTPNPETAGTRKEEA